MNQNIPFLKKTSIKFGNKLWNVLGPKIDKSKSRIAKIIVHDILRIHRFMPCNEMGMIFLECQYCNTPLVVLHDFCQKDN